MNYLRIYLAIEIKNNWETEKSNYNSKGRSHFFTSSDTELVNIVRSMGKTPKGVSQTWRVPVCSEQLQQYLKQRHNVTKEGAMEHSCSVTIVNFVHS